MDRTAIRTSQGGMAGPWSLPVQRNAAARALNTVLAVAIHVFLSGGPTPTQQTGDLRIVGSRAMTAAIGNWTALFHKKHPQVHVRQVLIGDGAAASALASRRADLAPLSRPLAPQERSLIGPAAQPVGIPVGATISRRGGGNWVYLYVASPGDGPARSLALDFVRTALSPAGQARMTGSFAPLPDGQRSASLSQLATLNRTAMPHP